MSGIDFELAGVGTFTPTGAKPLNIRAGDTLFFPANTTGEWHAHLTLRPLNEMTSLSSIVGTSALPGWQPTRLLHAGLRMNHRFLPR